MHWLRGNVMIGVEDVREAEDDSDSDAPEYDPMELAAVINSIFFSFLCTFYNEYDTNVI